MRIKGNRTIPAIAAILMLALIVGCASGGPTELLSPPPDQMGDDSAQSSAALPETVTIDAIEIGQTAVAARIVILTSEALVWTTYRDADDRLVVELPNSHPAPFVRGLEPQEGLVSAVDLATETVGNRPLTRLVIGTRGQAEHSVSATSGGLKVEFGTVEQLAQMEAIEQGLTPGSAEASMQQAAIEETDTTEPAPMVYEPADIAYEDVQADVAVAEAPETTVWESEPMAEVESEDLAEAESVPAFPVTPVSVDGPPATELHNIDVIRVDDSVVVRIVGDGSFSYETLSLEAPYRYVVDLAGVANFAPQSVYGFTGEPVEQVRVAQFKSQPDPVSRVVIDLAYPATPELVGMPDGLALSFGGTAAASWAAATTLTEDVATTSPMDTTEVAAPVSSQVYEEAPAAYGVPEPVVYEPAEVAFDEAPSGEQYADASLMQDPAPTVEAYDPPAEESAVTAAEPEAMPAPINIQFAPVEPESDNGSELFNSRNLPSAGQKVYRGEPVTMHLKDADVRDLLRSFSEFSGLNFVIQPGVRGTVTVQLTDVPWDQALDLILKTNDLGYELEGNILRIAPLSKLREEAEAEQRLRAAQAQAVPLSTVIKRVSYANASQVASVLRSGSNSVLSRRGSVIVDGRTNTLIIKELPNFIDTVIAVIETLDIPEPQVMIEARIIETTKRFSRTLGINWGFDGIASAATGNTTGLQFPNNGSIDGNVNLAQAGNGTLGISLGNVLNTFTLDIALQAAETDGLINILSAPRITTLNNESASIQSGLQIPIQTVANNTVSVQFVNATLQLSVTPHVTAEGTVLMDIDIQKREPLLAFAVAGASNAPISTKDASTRVIVRDGGTTVIGGIYEVTSDEGQDRVAGLWKIPLLKHLFKNNRQSEENEELLIFITPRVVNL